MTKNEGNGLIVFLIIFAIAVGVLVLYFLSQLALFVGIAGLLGCIVLLIWALNEGNSQITAIACIGLLVSGLFTAMGYAGVRFFENTDSGKTLVDSSATIVDAGADTYRAVADIKTSEADIHKGVAQAISPPQESLNP